MRNAAIIPENKVASLPLAAVGILNLSCLREKIIEDQTAFCFRHIDDAIGNLTAEEKRNAAIVWMGPD